MVLPFGCAIQDHDGKQTKSNSTFQMTLSNTNFQSYRLDRYAGNYGDVEGVTLSYKRTGAENYDNASMVRQEELWIAEITGIQFGAKYDFKAIAWKLEQNGNQLVLFSGEQTALPVDHRNNSLTIMMIPVDLSPENKIILPAISKVTKPSIYEINENINISYELLVASNDVVKFELTAEDDNMILNRISGSTSDLNGAQILGKTLYKIDSSIQIGYKAPTELVIRITVKNSLNYTYQLSFTIPLANSDLSKPDQISSSEHHSCALRENKTVQCWGRNQVGQLGDNTTKRRLLPVTVTGISNAIAISTGDRHNCALLEDKSIKCWGRNLDGEIGDGTNENPQKIPADVYGVSNAVAVDTGNRHSCALLDNQSIVCWGRNDNGQLGDGTTNSSYVPVVVSGISNAIKIGLGSYHTCAVLDNKSVQCWGRNNYGQLGNGEATSAQDNTSIPVTLVKTQDVKDVDAKGISTCAVLNNKSISCWGRNEYGQLGNGITGGSNSVPVIVSGISNATEITNGYRHACAVLDNKSAQCWGRNNQGQLGDGTFVDRNIPVAVTGVKNVVEIAPGYRHTCALLDNDTVQCWGQNNQGQLGDGTTNSRTTPAEVQF